MRGPASTSDSGADELSQLRRAGRGEAEALHSLYERYAPIVFAVALRIVTNRAESEEVVQDTFLEVWRRAGEYDPRRGSPIAWIVTIGRTRAIDRLRARGAQDRMLAQADAAPPSARSPAELTEGREARERVQAALAELPVEQRRVLELAYFEGLSQSEIAKKTGDALGTVKTRVRLGMEKLAATLAELWRVRPTVTCEEFKALAPAWALGALEEEESEACEAHLASPRLHEGCELASARAEQAAQLMAQALKPVAPPETAWNEIERRLAQETEAAVRRASALPRWSRLSGTLALAASVAVVFLLIGNRLGRGGVDRDTAPLKELQARTASDLALSQTARSHLEEVVEGCRLDLKTADDSLAERQRALALLAEPSTQVFGLAPQPSFSASGSLILNRPKHRAMVFAKSLGVVANRDYELWIIRNGDKIPAGLLKLEAGGSALGLIDDPLLAAGADAIAVTLEAAGGGTVPRGPLVLVADIIKG